MKKGITYLFLIVYTTVMLKPLAPYVSDVVAHIFWKYEHISTVHFEHGKYHTHYESLEAAAKRDPVPNSNLSKNVESVPDHIFCEERRLFHSPTISAVHLPAVCPFAMQAFYPPNFRPPRA